LNASIIIAIWMNVLDVGSGLARYVATDMLDFILRAIPSRPGDSHWSYTTVKTFAAKTHTTPHAKIDGVSIQIIYKG